MENYIIALIGSGALAAIVSGAVTLIGKAVDRKNQKEDRTDEITAEIAKIEKALKKSEIDNVRLQMMLLMADYPEDTAELMRVAEHYFCDLGGNWYMTTMFNTWIQKNNISKPEWLKDKGE